MSWGRVTRTLRARSSTSVASATVRPSGAACLPPQPWPWNPRSIWWSFAYYGKWLTWSSQSCTRRWEWRSSEGGRAPLWSSPRRLARLLVVPWCPLGFVCRLRNALRTCSTRHSCSSHSSRSGRCGRWSSRCFSTSWPRLSWRRFRGCQWTSWFRFEKIFFG